MNSNYVHAEYTGDNKRTDYSAERNKCNVDLHSGLWGKGENSNMVLNVLANNKHDELFYEINKLKEIIRIDHETEINIIDGMDKLIHWAMASEYEWIRKKRIVLITSEENNEILENLILKNSIKLLSIVGEPSEIASRVAEILVQDWCIRDDSEKEVLYFTEVEADAICNLYIDKGKLTKIQQNVKYRVIRKLNLNNCYQLFIWWVLTNVLPKKELKKEILIKFHKVREF